MTRSRWVTKVTLVIGNLFNNLPTSLVILQVSRKMHWGQLGHWVKISLGISPQLFSKIMKAWYQWYGTDFYHNLLHLEAKIIFLSWRYFLNFFIYCKKGSLRLDWYLHIRQYICLVCQALKRKGMCLLNFI